MKIRDFSKGGSKTFSRRVDFQKIVQIVVGIFYG